MLSLLVCPGKRTQGEMANYSRETLLPEPYLGGCDQRDYTLRAQDQLFQGPLILVLSRRGTDKPPLLDAQGSAKEM